MHICRRGFVFALGIAIPACTSSDSQSRAATSSLDSLRAEADSMEKELADRYAASTEWNQSIPSRLGVEVYTAHVYNALVAHGQPVIVRGRIHDIVPDDQDYALLLSPEILSEPSIYFRLTASAESLAPLIADPPGGFDETIIAAARVQRVRKALATWRARPLGDQYFDIELEPDVATFFVGEGELLDWKRVGLTPLSRRLQVDTSRR